MPDDDRLALERALFDLARPHGGTDQAQANRHFAWALLRLLKEVGELREAVRRSLPPRSED